MQEAAAPTKVHLSKIRVEGNYREFFDADEMAELTRSVRDKGVIEPILLRPDIEDGRFVLIAGERRLLAARAAFNGDYEIPCVVHDVSPQEAAELQIIENSHRANPSPMEEAQAALKIVYAYRNDKDEAARVLGWSVEKLERRLALLQCSRDVRQALIQRRILLGHAELLATLDESKQSEVLPKILAHNVSVAVLKEQLGHYAHRLADAIFDTSVCASCRNNSARQSELFGEHLGHGFCTRPAHYQELTEQALQARAAALREEHRVVRIVRAGDGFIPLKVQADGPLGVGAEQAALCRSCDHYGATVSAVAGSVGAVETGLCMDAACNQKHVAARMRMERAAMQGARERPADGSARPPETSATGTRLKAASIARAPLSQGVIAYREEQFRRMASTELLAQRDKARGVLIALALSGRTSAIDDARFRQATEATTGAVVRNPVEWSDALRIAGSITQEQAVELEAVVSVSSAYKLASSELPALLTFLAVDEAIHWRLCKEFLDLLTKSEIAQIAAELGLDRHLGGRFKKLVAGTKAELVAGLLAAEGFDFTGKIPALMRYERVPLA